MHTSAYWLSFDEQATRGLGRDELAAGLSGVGNLGRNLAPIYCLCEPRDIGSETHVRSPLSQLPTVFFYDAIPGGVGLAEKLFEVRRDLIEACLALVRACECVNGCPGCVGPQVDTNSKAKAAARVMLERVLG
jgi:DEAD/DEAH box helicase domain-containing protein